MRGGSSRRGGRSRGRSGHGPVGCPGGKACQILARAGGGPRPPGPAARARLGAARPLGRRPEAPVERGPPAPRATAATTPSPRARRARPSTGSHAAQGGVTLLAPEGWEGGGRRGGRARRSADRADLDADGPAPRGEPRRRSPPIDSVSTIARAFVEEAPAWALRGWGTYSALMARGAAFGVRHGEGFAALAWVFDQSHRHDALAVHTAAEVPRARPGEGGGLGPDRPRGARPLQVPPVVDPPPRTSPRSPSPRRSACPSARSRPSCDGPPAIARVEPLPGYPIELHLGGKVAVVVGLGAVGRRKASGLDRGRGDRRRHRPGAGGGPRRRPRRGCSPTRRPTSDRGIAGLRVGDGRGQPPRRRRRPGPLGSGSTRRAIPDTGDFAIPAIHRDGPLTLSVSTGGASPALAALLARPRRRLPSDLPPEGSPPCSRNCGRSCWRGSRDPEARRDPSSPRGADPRWLDLWETEGREALRRRLLEALG